MFSIASQMRGYFFRFDFKKCCICAIFYTNFYIPFLENNQMTLTTKQRQFLKGLAHHLSPVVMLGGNGLTEGVLAEIDNALNHHELIKVKIAGADREVKQLIIDAIVRETNAVNVQTIGHVLVLYRQSDDKKITLPKATKSI